MSDRDSVDAGTPDEATNDDVYLLEPRTGRTVRLTTDPAIDQFPVISRDGKTLLFESTRSTPEFPNPAAEFAFYSCRLNLRERTPTCTHPRRVAPSVPAGYYPYYALTPDSRSIVYSNGDLYRAPLDGRSAPARLAASASQPDVSPDGRRVAYTSLGNLWTVGIDGEDPVQLTNRSSEPAPPVYAGPDWSPDGDRLAFHSNRGGLPDFDVWVMRASPLDTANVPVDLTAAVTGPDGQRPSHERFPTWSPDGEHIAFFWHREPPSAGVAAGFNEGEIYAIRADGSRVRDLTANYDVALPFDDIAQIGDISPDWGAAHGR